MKIRSLVACIAISSLIGFPAIADAATKIKVGTKCAKVGQSQSQSGKRYICTKSGSKLLWREVVTPTAVKPTGPKPTVPLGTSWPLNAPATTVEDVITFADKAIRRYAATVPASQSNIEILAGPNTDMVQMKKRFNSLFTAAQFFSKDFSPSQPVRAVGATVSDYEYIYDFWKKNEMLASMGDTSKAAWIKWGDYCNQGAASYESAPIFWGCIGPYSDTELADIGLSKFGAHEYTHLVQAYNFYVKDGKQPWGAPNLFQEGSADYFGITLASDEKTFVKNWDRYRRVGYLSSTLVGYDLKALNKEGMYKLLVDQMNGDNRLAGHWYYTGAYVTARLVAAKGYEGFIEFMKEAGTSRDAKAAFSKVYGETFDQFAQQIAPELVEFTSIYGDGR